MRRLLFNPLDQEPCASGEYIPSLKYFLLDKQLVYGLYLCIMHVELAEAEINTYTSLLYCGTNNISKEQLEYDVFFNCDNAKYKMFLTDGDLTNIIVRNADNSVLDTSYNYTIYLYKVF